MWYRLIATHFDLRLGHVPGHQKAAVDPILAIQQPILLKRPSLGYNWASRFGHVWYLSCCKQSSLVRNTSRLRFSMSFAMLPWNLWGNEALWKRTSKVSIDCHCHAVRWIFFNRVWLWLLWDACHFWFLQVSPQIRLSVPPGKRLQINWELNGCPQAVPSRSSDF